MSKLIKLDNHFYIVDDSKIREGEDVYGDRFINNSYIYYNSEEVKTIFRKTSVNICRGNFQSHLCMKITHSTEPLEGVIQLNLPELEEIVYRYSVVKMADKYFLQEYSWTGVNNLPYKESDVQQIKNNYIKGFQAHQELVKDKLFTVEDMIDAFHKGMRFSSYPLSSMNRNQYLRTLLPKTEWDITFDEQGKIKLL